MLICPRSLTFKKHEHVKQAIATVLEEDKSLKQEWHQLSKTKLVTKPKATAFRTKQHKLNESIRKATTAQNNYSNFTGLMFAVSLMRHKKNE